MRAVDRTINRLQGLTPETRDLCLVFISVAADQGIPVRLTQAWRSSKVQNALWWQGRTDRAEVNALREEAGLAPLKSWERNKVVTNAPAGSSRHEFGEAFDVVPMRWDQRLVPNWASPHWKKLGEIGEALGLVWGGRWTKPDRPHFNLKQEE
jgi:peptidoglycan L-alanyl-D-glutamate endopeptidase CwlK